MNFHWLPLTLPLAMLALLAISQAQAAHLAPPERHLHLKKAGGVAPGSSPR